MRCVFVRFLEEIEVTKKTFWKYLTFSSIKRKGWRFCHIFDITKIQEERTISKVNELSNLNKSLNSGSGSDSGQLISRANCQAINSSMRCVFVRFLEEIEDTKKTFRNYLTFKKASQKQIIFWGRRSMDPKRQDCALLSNLHIVFSLECFPPLSTFLTRAQKLFKFSRFYNFKKE